MTRGAGRPEAKRAAIRDTKRKFPLLEHEGLGLDSGEVRALIDLCRFGIIVPQSCFEIHEP